jgi:hypothetical protein
MSLPAILRVPRSQKEWDKFHWQHYIDHKIILGVVASKAGKTLHMPIIWPVPGKDFTPQFTQFHQFLHQQMNVISGSSSADMSHASIATKEAAQTFVDANYREHLIFHEFVGVPV